MTQTEQIFLGILRAALKHDTPESPSLPEDGNWPELVRLALQHKLLPLMASGLPLQEIPGGNKLKFQALQQAAFQTQRTRAFLDLYAQLEAAGFHPLVVKGILCRSLYPQPDLRPSSDEDLYIAPSEFTGCCRFLQEQGFVPTGPAEDNAFEIGWRRQDLYIELHQQLFAPDSGAYGDLNRFFAPNGVGYPTEYGRTVVSLEPQDHGLYLLLHAFKHFLHSGFGIRQVCDICLWFDRYHREIHWDAMTRHCRDCDALGFARAVLGIGVHYLDIPLNLPPHWQVTPEYCLPMLRDLLRAGIYGSADRERQHSATVTLNAVEASRAGSKASLLTSLFPPREQMEARYPRLKKQPLLLPLAWGHRIAGYVRRRNRPAESLRIGKERIALLKHYEIIP